jgi:hypothetical protein
MWTAGTGYRVFSDVLDASLGTLWRKEAPVCRRSIASAVNQLPLRWSTFSPYLNVHREHRNVFAIPDHVHKSLF